MSIKTNQKKFWAYNDIFDVFGSELKAYNLIVYLCLIRHADSKGQCYPSYNLIAKKCGVSRRTVINAINKLIELDFISLSKRKVNNGSYTSNLYTIKELPHHTNTTKDAVSALQDQHNPSAADTPPLVQEMHHPSAADAPPLVQEMHHPSAGDAPEGRKTEGQLNYKDDETKDGQALNNKVDLSELKSPIFLSEQTLKALHKLPDNNKKQEVLDVLAASMKKGTIRKPEAYLQTLIQRSLDGDLTPLNNSIPEKIDSNFIKNLEYNNSLSLEQKTEIFNKYRRQKINDCPYCDTTGYIRFLEENGDMHGKVCTHEKIERLPRRVVKILTAKPGYEQPGTQGLTHISELNVINSLREKFSEKFGDEQCDFEAPF
ncbi:helix-turn-helix domain-containing protein [Candidatus Marithrix sp. Canyon 246]|uniref:helix-turn-helix domain-containing protein n=1 Tax=Candidatus Marithrix sp. Canyon 246 TaxID=1827136 RepID=UPI00084A0B16|nr:helix-turn-helix domain-containing protein [Candidatus Marithrix sp. Canyon 246]